MAKIDRLNALYNSKNPEDIIKFYDNFKTPEELIAWSKSRPKGRAKIYIVKGKRDVVVVIPTADRYGKFAKNCEKNIYKGQQIVFVESGGKEDPYFNYARNCNAGLRYALKYKPDWVVLSNDDLLKVDDINKLKSELSQLNYNDTDSVFLKNSESRPYDLVSVLVKETKVLRLYRYIRGGFTRKLQLIKDKFDSHMTVIGKRRFTRLDSKLFYRKIGKFYGFFDFIIINRRYLVSRKQFFDPVFINGCEDHFLSYNLSKRPERLKVVDFGVGSIGGYTLGSNHARKLREIASQVYFNYLLKRGIKRL